MAGSKKVGGLRTGSTPAVVSGNPKAGKRVGRLILPKSYCPKCQGRIINGQWIHTEHCPETVVMWFALGFKVTDWTSVLYDCCPHKCAGQSLASCVTHSDDCPFWLPMDREILKTMPRPTQAISPRLESYLDEQEDLDL